MAVSESQFSIRLIKRNDACDHAASIESGEMIIRYTCDGKAIGQTMFHYTPETYVDWFRSMMNEMNPGTGGSTKKNKVKGREKRPPARGSWSHRPHSRKRESRTAAEKLP